MPNPHDDTKGNHLEATYRKVQDLDDRWTKALQSKDHGQVDALTAELDTALGELADGVTWLAGTADDLPDDELLDAALANAGVSADDAAKIREHVARQGGAKATRDAALSELNERLPAIRKENADQSRKAKEGHDTPGKLYSRDQCLLATAFFLGGWWCAPLAGAGAVGMINYCF